MRRITVLLFLTCLLSTGLSAPVEVKEDGIEKRRDSTKETIELEEALKRLSGENKKFFPSPNGQPQPQVDGLDDATSNEDRNDPMENENSNELANKDGFESDENEEEPISNEQENEPMNDENEDALQDLERFQTKDKEEAEDLSDQNIDTGFEEEQADNIQQSLNPAYVDYGGDRYQDYYADLYGEMENGSPEETQYAYASYDTTYPIADRYGEMEQDYYAVPEGDTEEYLLQNMLHVIQQHPKLLQMLQNGQELIKDEDVDGYDQNEEDLDQLGNPASSTDTKQLDSYKNLPLEDDGEEAASRQEQDSALNLPMQQQEGFDVNDFGTNDQDKIIMKQLETLQELYGDKGAHTVAKKMGYDSRNDVYTDEQDLPGSGDIDLEQSNNILNDDGPASMKEEDNENSSNENRLQQLGRISAM